MKFFLKYNMEIMSLIFIIISFILFLDTTPFYEAGLTSFFKGFLFLDDVLIYIIGIEVLKASLTDRSLLKSLRYDASDYSKNQTRVLSFFSAFPFGLGVSSFLKGLASDPIDTKPISQGMTLSMLVYPTTLASGYVFDTLEMQSILSILVNGLPIVIICFILMVKKENNFFGSFPLKLLSIVIILGLINYIYLQLFSYFIPNNFMIKQSIFYLLIAFILNPNVLVKLPKILISNLKILVFFMCIGVLGNYFIQWFDTISHNFYGNNINFYLVIFIVIFIIPLVSMLFVHPLVIFLITYPIVTPYFDLTNLDINTIYIIWVTMLINAQLLSPVSLTTVLAVGNNNNNIFSESFIKHYRFALIISTAVFLYLVSIRLLTGFSI